MNLMLIQNPRFTHKYELYDNDSQTSLSDWTVFGEGSFHMVLSNDSDLSQILRVRKSRGNNPLLHQDETIYNEMNKEGITPNITEMGNLQLQQKQRIEHTHHFPITTTETYTVAYWKMEKFKQNLYAFYKNMEAERAIGRPRNVRALRPIDFIISSQLLFINYTVSKHMYLCTDIKPGNYVINYEGESPWELFMDIDISTLQNLWQDHLGKWMTFITQKKSGLTGIEPPDKYDFLDRLQHTIHTGGGGKKRARNEDDEDDEEKSAKQKQKNKIDVRIIDLETDMCILDKGPETTPIPSTSTDIPEHTKQIELFLCHNLFLAVIFLVQLNWNILSSVFEYQNYFDEMPTGIYLDSSTNRFVENYLSNLKRYIFYGRYRIKPLLKQSITREQDVPSIIQSLSNIALILFLDGSDAGYLSFTPVQTPETPGTPGTPDTPEESTRTPIEGNEGWLTYIGNYMGKMIPVLGFGQGGGSSSDYYRKKYLKYKKKYKQKKYKQKKYQQRKYQQHIIQSGGGFQEYKEKFIGKLKRATLKVHEALDTGQYGDLPDSLLSIAMD